MSLWLEQKYASLLSPRFRNNKRIDSHTWNFACPECGDSKKDKRKSRGFIYKKKDKLNYTCKNCGHGTTFLRFLKKYDPDLYREYVFEAQTGTRSTHKPTVIQKISEAHIRVVAPTRSIFRVSELPPEHSSVHYLAERKIPRYWWDDIFHTEEWWAWCHKANPRKYKDPKKGDEPRIMIPIRSRDGELAFMQGRKLLPGDGPKYVNIQIRQDVPLVWNLDCVDLNLPVPVLEGPFDAMFVQNAVATGGGDIVSALSEVGIPRPLVVYDNEPRAPLTVKKMLKAVENGLEVCVWPEKVKQKDVNDMVKAGITPEKINSMIIDNCFSGAKALVKIGTWRKC